MGTPFILNIVEPEVKNQEQKTVTKKLDNCVYELSLLVDT
jgi:hypothetical protein